MNEKEARAIILTPLRDTIPVPVRVSFDTEGAESKAGKEAGKEGKLVINVWWPEYRLSWMGRPEEHRLRAAALVQNAFAGNVLSRFVGMLVSPFVADKVSTNPVILMPRTEVVYRSRHFRLTVDDPADTQDDDYMHDLLSMWALELRREALLDRGAVSLG